MRGECITWRIAQRFGQLRRLCHGGKRAAQLFEGQRCGQLWGRCGRQRGWWCWCWCGWWVIAERVRAQMCWKIVIHTCIARRGGGDQSDAICSCDAERATTGAKWGGCIVQACGRATCVCMCVCVSGCVLPIVNPNQTKIKPSEDTHKHNTHTDVFKHILDIDICILQGRHMYSNYLLLLLFVPNNKRKFN